MINYMGYRLYLSNSTPDNFSYIAYNSMTNAETNALASLFDNDDNIKTILAKRIIEDVDRYGVTINTHRPLSNKPPKVKVSVVLKNSDTIHFSDVDGYNYIPTLHSYTILDNGCTIASFNVDSINFIYEHSNQFEMKRDEPIKSKKRKGVRRKIR